MKRAEKQPRSIPPRLFFGRFDGLHMVFYRIGAPAITCRFIFSLWHYGIAFDFVFLLLPFPARFPFAVVNCPFCFPALSAVVNCPFCFSCLFAFLSDNITLAVTVFPSFPFRKSLRDL